MFKSHIFSDDFFKFLNKIVEAIKLPEILDDGSTYYKNNGVVQINCLTIE